LELRFETTQEVENWFGFVGSVLKEYGDGLLRNVPGIFDELAKAQAHRESEFVDRMNREHGLAL